MRLLRLSDFGITPGQINYWDDNGWLAEEQCKISRGPGNHLLTLLSETELLHLKIMVKMINELDMKPRTAQRLAWNLMGKGTAIAGDFEIRLKE